MTAPVVPFLTDAGLESVLEAAAEAGASAAGYTLMRLPWELKDLFKDWLVQNFPLKAEHVMSRVRQMRKGKENDPNFGTRQKGEGVVMISQSEWESIEETLYLLRSPRNAARLLDAIRGLDAGEGEEHELIEP